MDGSMPSRYQRSSVPTANECLRSWTRGLDAPGGIGSLSRSNSWWKVPPIAVRLMALLPSNENSSASALIRPVTCGPPPEIIFQ